MGATRTRAVKAVNQRWFFISIFSWDWSAGLGRSVTQEVRHAREPLLAPERSLPGPELARFRGRVRPTNRSRKRFPNLYEQRPNSVRRVRTRRARSPTAERGRCEPAVSRGTTVADCRGVGQVAFATFTTKRGDHAFHRQSSFRA